MPQPIDLQTGLTQITQAERVQQIAERVSLAAQQRTAVETQEQRVASETEVQQTHAKTDDVDQEMRRRNPYMGRRRHHDQAEDKEAEAKPRPVADGEEHHLDVVI